MTANTSDSRLLVDYSDGYLGYLIMETPGAGFRYMSYERDEYEEYSEYYKTQREAIQAAVQDWRENGQGDNWADWSKRMAKDAEVNYASEEDKVKEIANIIRSAGVSLVDSEVQALSEALAARAVIITKK